MLRLSSSHLSHKCLDIIKDT